MTGRRRKPGRMGPFIGGYRAWLAGRGYSPGTIVNMLAMAGGLGRWMDARGIAPGALDRAVITEFRDALRLAGMRCVPGAHGLDPLLGYLGDQGVLDGHPSPAAPAGVLAERYRRWLVADRGLAEVTVVRYVKLARSFLSQCLAGRGGLDSLSGTDVAVFLLAESERLSVGSVKGRVGELRSLLRFLYLQGLTPRPMAAAVPPVAGWRDTGVPKAIPAGDVQRLLDSCDRGDLTGIRDYAILMLAARLGLRSAEVARLELGDIDCRAGQITLRGKACRQDGRGHTGRGRGSVGARAGVGARRYRAEKDRPWDRRETRRLVPDRSNLGPRRPATGGGARDLGLLAPGHLPRSRSVNVFEHSIASEHTMESIIDTFIENDPLLTPPRYDQNRHMPLHGFIAKAARRRGRAVRARTGCTGGPHARDRAHGSGRSATRPCRSRPTHLGW
jgi:hypothetical protein